MAIIHTQKEISSALNVLKSREENLILDRTRINQRIKENRENVKYYEELDLSQYKAF